MPLELKCTHRRAVFVKQLSAAPEKPSKAPDGLAVPKCLVVDTPSATAVAVEEDWGNTSASCGEPGMPSCHPGRLRSGACSRAGAAGNRSGREGKSEAGITCIDLGSEA